MPKLGYECWLAVDKIIAKIIRLTFWGLTFQRVFSAIYLQNTVQCVCVCAELRLTRILAMLYIAVTPICCFQKEPQCKDENVVRYRIQRRLITGYRYFIQ